MNSLTKRKTYTFLILAALLTSAVTIFLPFVSDYFLFGASLFDIGNDLGKSAEHFKTPYIYGPQLSEQDLAISRIYTAGSIIVYLFCITYIGLFIVSVINVVKAQINGNKGKLILGGGPLFAIILYVAFIIEYFLAKNDRPVSGVVAVIGYSLQVYDKIALFPFVGIVLSIAAIVLCKLRNAEPVVSTEPSPEPSEEPPIIEKAPAAPAAPVSTKAPAAPAAPVSRSTPKAAPASEGARCPSCGKALRAGIAFCIYCGTPLAPAPAKPAEEKPEPVPPAAETGSKLRINMRVDKTSSGGDAKPSASGFKPAGDSDLD